MKSFRTRLTYGAVMPMCVFLCLLPMPVRATGGDDYVTWTYVIGGSYPINRVINGNSGSSDPTPPPSDPCKGISCGTHQYCSHGQCVCEEGYESAGSNCVCPGEQGTTCGPTTYYDATNCVAYRHSDCGSGKICVENACQSCPENYVPNVNKTACVCGITSCPAGQKKDGCTCVSCGTLPDGHEWTTGCTSKCVRTAADCDANQEFDATACQCRAKTCVDASENYTCPVENGTDVNGCPVYREKTIDDCAAGQYLNGCDCATCPTPTEFSCIQETENGCNKWKILDCSQEQYKTVCDNGQCICPTLCAENEEQQENCSCCATSCEEGMYLDDCVCHACPGAETYCNNDYVNELNADMPSGCAQNIYQACNEGMGCSVDQQTCEELVDDCPVGEVITENENGNTCVWVSQGGECLCSEIGEKEFSYPSSWGGGCDQIGCCWQNDYVCHCGCPGGQVCKNGSCTSPKQPEEPYL